MPAKRVDTEQVESLWFLPLKVKEVRGPKCAADEVGMHEFTKPWRSVRNCLRIMRHVGYDARTSARVAKLADALA